MGVRGWGFWGVTSLQLWDCLHVSTGEFASHCFPHPQLAPTSTRSAWGGPDKRTALQWASQPNMLSSSTLLGQPATYPWTAGSGVRIYSLTTWTHRTSVTSDISKWDWCKLWPPFFRAIGRKAWEGASVYQALLLCQALYTRHHFLFVQDSGLSILQSPSKV